MFEPWMKNSEVRKQEGLRKPVSLVEACEILGDSKNLQDNAEAKLKVCSGSAYMVPITIFTSKVLEDAAASAQKMTSHQEADEKVSCFLASFFKALSPDPISIPMQSLIT